MTTYTGALAAKKKQELQDLATDLGVDTGGTKESLQERIKAHLAANQDLMSDPRFSGLYSKRKALKNTEEASQQPSEPSPAVEESYGVQTRRSAARISHPPSSPDLRLKVKEAQQVALPPTSPVRSVIAALSNAMPSAPEPEAVVQAVEEQSRVFYAEAHRALTNTRAFLSNARNISSLTLLAELLFIIYVFVPWDYYAVPLGTTNHSVPTPATDGPSTDALVPGRVVHIPYPPASFLKSVSTYSLLLRWAIPNLLLPQMIGVLVSFRAGEQWIQARQPDPLSAAIVRIACAIAGDWGINWSALGVTPKWRILGASVAGAFALAEAIGEKRAGFQAVEPADPDNHAEDEDETSYGKAVARRHSDRRH
ncbi:hypothetical protein FRB99_003075 [Tulasnella sp. 403]|nr:hypothetical protein FRB99_003075 [Tulasnella sp. 403]